MRHKKICDEDFIEELDNALIDFNISEKKLAEACGVSQKSINRYRNGITDPEKNVKDKIRAYIKRVKDEQVEVGKKYISKEDKEFLDLISSLNDGTEGIVYLSERLKYYTPVAQRYIVRFLPVYMYIDEEERAFIESLRKMHRIYRDKVLALLENQPISIEYLECFEYELMNSEPDSPQSKMRGYLDIISATVELKGNIHTKYDKETKETNALALRECTTAFDEITEEYFYRTGKYVAPDFFERINEYMLGYTHKEWYYLYLFNRLKVMDTADKYSKTVFDMENNTVETERMKQLKDYISFINSR